MNLLHCAKSRTSQEINRFRHVWKQHFHINLRQIKLRKCTQAANPERDCLCKHISPLHANDLAPPNPASFPLPTPPSCNLSQTHLSQHSSRRPQLRICAGTLPLPLEHDPNSYAHEHEYYERRIFSVLVYNVKCLSLLPAATEPEEHSQRHQQRRVHSPRSPRPQTASRPGTFPPGS